MREWSELKRELVLLELWSVVKDCLLTTGTSLILGPLILIRYILIHAMSVCGGAFMCLCVCVWRSLYVSVCGGALTCPPALVN